MEKTLQIHSSQKLIASHFSINLACFITALILLLFLYSPIQTNAQPVVVHTGASEDGDPKYDSDGVKNGVIVWGAGKIHVVYSYDLYEDNRVLKIQPGAIVKIGGITTDANGNIIGWAPGGIFLSGVQGNLQIDGAVITDIRDDSEGGDTNNDGSASQPEDDFDYDHGCDLRFPSNGNNYLKNSTIKYMREVRVLNTMPITNNRFYKIILFGHNNNPVLNSSPNISGNIFEFFNDKSQLYIDGMSPIIDGNTFRYANGAIFQAWDRFAIVLGLKKSQDSHSISPSSGVTKITNNIFETSQAISFTYTFCDSLFDGYIFHAEIINNVISGKSLNNQITTGKTAITFNSADDILIKENEFNNFETYLKIDDCSEFTDRIHINNNRFTLNTDGGGLIKRADPYKIHPNIDATNNYWGAASGPKDTYRYDGDWNPRGTGLNFDNKAYYIKYIPFTGGGIPPGKDKIHITAVTIDPLPDNNLVPELNATIRVNVDNFNLFTANSGKIVAYVQDNAGFYYNLPGAEVTVTADQHSVTVPDITFKVPVTAATMNVTAILFPDGDLPTTSSNTINFKVEQLSNNVELVKLKGLNEGQNMTNGNNYNLTAEIKYTLTTSSPVLNGTLEFEIKRYLQFTNEVLQEFPLITMPVESGSDKIILKEIPLSFALLNYRPAVEQISIKVLLKDENGIVKGSDKISDFVDPASEIWNIEIFPANNSDGIFERTGCYNFISGEKLIYIAKVQILNKLKDVNNIQLIMNRYEFIWKNSGSNSYYPVYQCVKNIEAGEKNYNFNYVSDIVLPQDLKQIKFYFSIKDAAGTTSIMDRYNSCEVESPNLTSSQPLPTGASTVQFTPVRAMVNISSNTQAGELTAAQINSSPGSSNIFMKSNRQADNTMYWKFIPINTYWLVYESQPVGDVAGTISFQYEPATDFPSNPLFDENKLVIAGLNPYSGEYEALTTTLDINSHTVTAVYEKFFQTWIVASLDSVLTDVEQPFKNEIPSSYWLSQNYPNPFNPITNFGFHILKSGLVSIKIYDVLGTEVAVLINEEKTPGSYRIKFNASNLSSGIYFYRLKSGNYVETKKMILLK